MIRVDSYDEMNGADWFCYHMSSPYIFPAGFCASHDILLSAPKGWVSASFNWPKYLLTTGCAAAPPHLFNRVCMVHKPACIKQCHSYFGGNGVFLALERKICSLIIFNGPKIISINKLRLNYNNKLNLNLGDSVVKASKSPLNRRG